MRNQLDVMIFLRGVLLPALTTRFGTNAPAVRALNQPQIVGATVGPTITIQAILNRRYGVMRRAYQNGEPMVNTSTQWMEGTFQIGAFAWRDPNEPDFLTLPAAMDYCEAAADVLQSDDGLAALGVERIRPLRVTDIRTVPWKNEADQYEFFPSFDLTLSYPRVIVGTAAPVAVFENEAGRV